MDMKGLILAVLCCFAAERYAAAIECPPDEPKDRPWLCGHLLDDMDVTNYYANAFGDRDFSRARALNNPKAATAYKIDDDDVYLLGKYYYRLRARAEEDVRQFQRQYSSQVQPQGQPQVLPQTAPTEAELKAAKDDRDAISRLGGKLAGKSKAVASLSALIYASLPGFCLAEMNMLPPSYFNLDQNNGGLQYVGPVPTTKLVVANPYVLIINNRLRAARQAYWPQYVRWQHNIQTPIKRPFAGGTRSGGGTIRGPSTPPPKQAQAGPGNGPPGTNRQR